MEKNLEISPCPFCGAKAESSSDYDSDDNRPDGYSYYVMCGDCGARGESHYAVAISKIHLTEEQYKKQNKNSEQAKQDAIASWNKRVK